MPHLPSILLLGSTGQVGYALREPLASIGAVVAPTRQDADLTDEEALRALVRRTAPDVIVNAAAYTAVDQAEEEPARAQAINGTAPGILAEEAARLGAWLVHYSTDYVFNGTGRTPYPESAPTAPLSVYGKTKHAGEEAIQERDAAHLILRTSWVYSMRRTNFLRTMLRLAEDRDTLSVVNDQVGCPTWAGWIAQATVSVLAAALNRDTPASDSGCYHLSASGTTSWWGFARAIFDVFDRDVTVVPISTNEYPTRASRPLYSVLDTTQIRQRFGIEVSSWQAQLQACHERASDTGAVSGG